MKKKNNKKNVKKINVFLKGFKPKPKDKIAINSLSLFKRVKHNNKQNINIKGIITLTIFGIK